MQLTDFIGNFFSFSTPLTDVNPANGLPMINDAIDIEGNPFGFDSEDGWATSAIESYNDGVSSCGDD